jgi:O-antigen/teichoic acid export membrane protein
MATGCVLAAYSGWGLIGQFGVTAACTLIPTLGLLFILRRVAPLGELLKPGVDISEPARRIRGLNRDTLVFQLVGRICIYTDTIVIALFLGPVTVVAFFLTTRLTVAAVGQVQSVGAATWAGLAELYQAGQLDLFRQRLRELTKLAAVLAGAGIVPLAALTGPFVGLWVGPEHYAGDPVAVLAVLNAFLLAIFGLWGWVFIGTGQVRRLIPYMIGQGVLALSVSLAATALFGVAGPPMGMAVVNLVYNPWVLSRYLRSDFGLRQGDLFAAVLAPFALSGIVLGLLFAVRHAWPEYSWARLGGEFAAAAILYLAAAWRFVLAEPERVLFRELIARLRQRGS